MRPLLAVVLLIALAFAGCTDDDSTTVTAKTALGKAQSRAAEWNADAELIGIAGIESKGFLEELEEDDDFLPPEFRAAVPRDDSKVGDGSAPAWMYVYSHEDHYFLIVTSGSRITFASGNFSDEILEEIHGSSATPLGSFDIDSDEAADIASDADDNFSVAASGRQSFGLYALGMDSDTGRPVWMVSMIDEENEVFAGAAIAADDGEILSLESSGLIDAEPLLQETGSITATPTAVEPSLDTFVVGDGHSVLHLRATAETMTPLSSVTLTIQDPDGNEHELVVSNANGATPATITNVLDIEDPAAGTWTATGTVSQSPRQEFTLDFCTDGMPGSAEPNAACA